MVQAAFQIFKALAAIPSLVKTLEDIAAGVFLWYLTRQNKETSKLIANAAALGARSLTQEDRQKANEAWRIALSRNRIIS